jgi:hypothetical protein
MSPLVLRIARPIALALVLSLAASFAWGVALDAPTMAMQAEGFFKVRLTVTAGASGAPGGFTVWWMKRADFDANGSQWFPAGGSVYQLEASFQGTPTLNLFPGDAATFLLGPGEVSTVECGDLFDETGVTHYSDMLDPGTEYVYAAFANEASGWEQSALSATVYTTTGINPNCTQGYWKTHGPPPCQTGNNSNDWPTNSLTLGTVNYTDAELCAILQTPAGGNGLISLAHQLITAKFNLLLGADASCVSADVAAADALIDGLVVPPVGGGFLDPSSTSGTTQNLDDYNNGLLCQPHICTPIATEPTTWGSVKGLYR